MYDVQKMNAAGQWKTVATFRGEAAANQAEREMARGGGLYRVVWGAAMVSRLAKRMGVAK